MAKAPTFILPTGYEDAQRKAERKRKIAQMMLQQGIGDDPNMRSWTQVLAHLGQDFAGKRLDKKADDLDADTNKRMLNDYGTRVAAFRTATAGSPDARSIVNNFGSDPFLTEQVKPYAEAMAARLKEDNTHRMFGDQNRLGSSIGEGEFAPNKPTDTVLRGPDNTFIENPVATVGALHRQAYDLGGPVASMTDPMANGAPTVPPMPPMQPPPMGALPAVTSGESMPGLELLSPEEREIMSRELQRRASGGSGNGAYTPPNPNTPMGSPLAAQRAPAGVVNGRPYWMINGQAYDNPEGR